MLIKIPLKVKKYDNKKGNPNGFPLKICIWRRIYLAGNLCSILGQKVL
jgi:hypothetical protein